MAYGVCKLTGQQGKLVRSHLLPKALTRTPTPGELRVEAGMGERPVRRHDGWYDRSLVTRAGEDILADLDDFAAKELRRLRMTWGSLSPDISLPSSEYDPIANTDFGFRELLGSNTSKLRLFFLSLLWRAAASDHYGFAHIEISSERLGQLRTMIQEGNPHLFPIYPISLIQITTIGDWHISTPSMEWKTLPSVDEEQGPDILFFRFFLDGLVVHLDDETTDPMGAERWGKLAVGGSETLHFMTRPFEGSRQSEEISYRLAETEREYGGLIDRILRPRGADDLPLSHRQRFNQLKDIEPE